MGGLVLSFCRGAMYTGILGVGAGVVGGSTSMIAGGVILAVAGFVAVQVLGTRPGIFTPIATGLSKAITNNDVASVRNWLKDGVDPNSQSEIEGVSVLSHAVGGGNLQIVRLLLDKGATPDGFPREAQSPLHWAVSTGKPEVARLLLEKGANPHVRDDAGHDVLEMAIRYDKPELVELLLAATGPSAGIDALLRVAKSDDVKQLLMSRGSAAQR